MWNLELMKQGKFNPYLEFSILIYWMSSFQVLGSGIFFHLYSSSNRHSCKQTV